MGSAFAGVFDFLLEQMVPRIQLVDPDGIVADTYVLERPAAGVPVLTIGADDANSSAQAGDSARAYIEVGANGEVEETFKIPCVISVQVGGPDQGPARRTVAAVFDQVVALVAADLTLSGLLQNGRWAQIGDVLWKGTDQGDPARAALGRWSTCAFAVQCMNSYWPGS